MIFLIFFSIIIVGIQIFLISLRSIKLFPEMYFLPWLSGKGLLPYKDFFDHHGFITHFLLAPLTLFSSSWPLNIFFYATEISNLIIVIVIVNKIIKNSKIILTLLTLLYLLTNYFFADNTLWFENIITFFFLLIYLLTFIPEFRFKSYLFGFLTALISFIKPPTALIIIPLFIIRKDLKIILSFLFSWILVLLFFLYSNALNKFITDLFIYNFYLRKNFLPYTFFDQKFLLFGLLLVLIAVGYITIKRDVGKVILPSIFFLISFVFIFIDYGRVHIVPFVPFGIFLIAYSFNYKKRVFYFAFIVLVFLYVILLLQEIKHEYVYQYKKEVVNLNYSEDLRAVHILNKINPNNKNIFLATNYAELYMYYNQKPPTYYPIYFFGEEKYFSNLEKNIINDLIKNQVYCIVEASDSPTILTRLPVLSKYIKSNFKILSKSGMYQFYCKR